MYGDDQCTGMISVRGRSVYGDDQCMGMISVRG